MLSFFSLLERLNRYGSTISIRFPAGPSWTTTKLLENEAPSCLGQHHAPYAKGTPEEGRPAEGPWGGGRPGLKDRRCHGATRSPGPGRPQGCLAGNLQEGVNVGLLKMYTPQMHEMRGNQSNMRDVANPSCQCGRQPTNISADAQRLKTLYTTAKNPLPGLFCRDVV